MNVGGQEVISAESMILELQERQTVVLGTLRKELMRRDKIIEELQAKLKKATKEAPDAADPAAQPSVPE